MSKSKNKPALKPNDQRARDKNPNNPNYNKAQGNRGKQLNPNQKGSGR
tara:strand:+ start:18204 stop:18347 length:144 start_codon:yes stop_codon:yes gene_type:complete